jgi:branched-chain amino acid transport system substrate-binding protein
MMLPPRWHRRSRLTAISIALAIAALVLVVAAESATLSARSSKSTTSSKLPPIVIGASSVLSGPAAYAGQDWLNGLKLGINQINASGGVLGRQIQIVTADNACDPGTAVSATRKLIDDNVSIILGSVCSGATLAAMPLVEAAHIVQLTDDSSSPQITQEAGVGGNPWEFRINLDSSMEGNALVGYIAAKVKTVYFIAENDAFGRDGVSGYAAPLKAAHVKIVGASYYTPGLGDFAPIVSAAQASNAAGIVLISEPKDAANIVRQLHEQSLKQAVFDGGGFLSQEFFSALGNPSSLANGIVGAFFWNPAEDPKFTKAYEAAYKTSPPPDGVGPYYDAFVLKKAIELAGSSNPTAIRNALPKVDIKEAWGTIKFDSHDQAHPNVAIQVASNGQVKLLKVVPSHGG